MDTQTFLDNFSTIADAPGGVDRLRKLILELAVRGHLVPHTNEDASHLLTEATAAKQRLVEEGATKRPREFRRTPLDLHVFPDQWLTAHLGDVCLVAMGNSPPGDSYNDVGEGVPLVNGPVEFSSAPLGPTQQTKYTIKPTQLFSTGDLLVCVRGATTGRTNVAAFDGCAGRGVALVRAWRSQPFVNLVMWRVGGELLALGKGTTFPSISYDDLAGLAIGVPPLSEQARIVAKVDELMQLCDDLEASQQARHHVAARLRASSLDALTNAETDDDLHTAWSRINTNWKALTDNPDSIDAVRKTVLHLAVRGKLVNQQQQDRPALELINQIRVERHQQGLRSGMEAAGKPSFRIPATWAWTTFGFVTDARLGKMLDKAKNTGPYRSYLRNTNVQWFRFELDDVAKLRLEDSEYEEYELHVGDLLICEGGEPGRAAVCDDTVAGLIFQKALHRARPLLGIEPWYLAFLLRSYAAGGLLAPHFTGATIKHLTGRSLARLPVPLPPVDEQRRIVDRVWELMRLCNDLEAGLASRRQSHEQLARALISMAS
jgi:type I restriction enzyme S subunit